MMNSVVDGSLLPARRNAGDTCINYKSHEGTPMSANLHGPVPLGRAYRQFRKSPDQWGHCSNELSSNPRFDEGQRHTVLPSTQTFLYPYPYAFHFPAVGVPSKSKSGSNGVKPTLMQTGISGKTLKWTFAPLTGLIFRLMTSSAVWSCLAVSLTPLPFMRRPHSP